MHRNFLPAWAGCAFFVSAANAAPALPVVTVVQPLERESAEYVFAAKLEPVERVEVRSQVPGRVAKIHAQIGAEVKKDELLAELDPRPLQESVKNAELQVRRSEREVQHRKELLDNAQTSARTLKPADFEKRIEGERIVIAKLLEKTRLALDEAIKKSSFSPRRDGMLKLRDVLTRTQRLAATRLKEDQYFGYPKGLEALAKAISNHIAMFPVRESGSANMKTETELDALRIAVDAASASVLARSQEGIDYLLAEHELAQANAAEAKASLEKARRDLEGTRLRAPIDGRVAQMAIKPGDLVGGGTRGAGLLAVLVRTDPVKVSFEIDQHTLLALKPSAATKRYETPVSLRIGEEKEFSRRGSVSFVENHVDAKKGTVHVEALFTNADGTLTPSLLDDKKTPAAWVRLAIAKPRKVLLVPDFALLSDETGNQRLNVVNDRNVVESRAVKTGTIIDGMRAIEHGLKPGEWVIVGGERRQSATNRQELSRDDFVKDLRMLGVKPGTVVEPVRTTLPNNK